MIMSCTASSREFKWRRQICNKMRSKHRNVRKQGKIWEKHLENSFYAPYFQRNRGKLSITEKLIKYKRRVLKFLFFSSKFSFNVYFHLSRNTGSKRSIEQINLFIVFLEGTVTNPAIWLVLYPVSIFLSLPTGHGNAFVNRRVHLNFRCHLS